MKFLKQRLNQICLKRDMFIAKYLKTKITILVGFESKNKLKILIKLNNTTIKNLIIPIN